MDLVKGLAFIKHQLSLTSQSTYNVCHSHPFTHIHTCVAVKYQHTSGSIWSNFWDSVSLSIPQCPLSHGYPTLLPNTLLGQ